MKFSNNKYFTYISESYLPIRTISEDENNVSLSEFRSAYFPNVVNNYSIKLTLNGVENYKINKKEFKVPKMCFLTASGPCESPAWPHARSRAGGR